MRIAILKPEFPSGVEYYRLDPWQYLGRQTDIAVDCFSSRKPAELETALKGYDILIASRPRIKADLHAISVAKHFGLKVILDYDDLIWEIPAVNPVATAHNSDDGGMIEIMFEADAIVSSTPALADYIKSRFGLTTTIVPNALNDIRPPWLTPAKDDPTPTVVWRGSNTHDGDLWAIRDAIRDDQRITYRWMGANPWYYLAEHGGNLPYLNHHQWANINVFHHALHQLAPHYGLFPLEGNPFNQCKSNIAFLDYTKVGAVTIAPRYMSEFQNLPCIHYDTVEELRKILDALHTRTDRAELLTRARQYINDNLMLTKVNELRVGVVNEVMREGG